MRRAIRLDGVKRAALHPLARQDLLQIVRYLTVEAGQNCAEAIRKQILAAVHRLTLMPGMGHVREDLTPRPLRFWSVQSYLIVYRADTDPIRVVRVLDGRQDVEGLLGEHDEGLG